MGAGRAARAAPQLLPAWPPSPLTSVVSCCSARACHFCLFFLQPSSRGKQSSDTRVRACGERERTLGGSRQPGRCPSPGPRPRATSLPRAVRAGWGSARCDRWRVRLSRYAAQGKHTVQAEAPDPGGRPRPVTVLPGAPALGLPRWSSARRFYAVC